MNSDNGERKMRQYSGMQYAVTWQSPTDEHQSHVGQSLLT
jgi:hypothetical protein